jgi:hypothetical protein
MAPGVAIRLNTSGGPLVAWSGTGIPVMAIYSRGNPGASSRHRGNPSCRTLIGRLRWLRVHRRTLSVLSARATCLEHAVWISRAGGGRESRRRDGSTRCPRGAETPSRTPGSRGLRTKLRGRATRRTRRNLARHPSASVFVGIQPPRMVLPSDTSMLLLATGGSRSARKHVVSVASIDCCARSATVTS